MKIFGRRINIFRGRFKRISIYPVFRLISLIVMVIALINSIYPTFLLFLLFFVLTYIFKFIRKKLKIEYPVFFDVILILFIFVAIYLGEINSLYIEYWWFDMLLHSLSGVMIGSWVFITIYNLLQRRIFTRSRIIFVSVFVFTTAITIDIIWEIFEFLMDFYLNFGLQDTLFDTMGDILADVIGSAITAIAVYIYLIRKKKKERII